MGFMDDLKKLAKPYAEDDDDFDEFDDDVRPSRASRGSTAPAPKASLDDLGLDDNSSSASFGSGRRVPGGNKVVNIHTTAQMQTFCSPASGPVCILSSFPRRTVPIDSCRRCSSHWPCRSCLTLRVCNARVVGCRC